MLSPTGPAVDGQVYQPHPGDPSYATWYTAQYGHPPPTQEYVHATYAAHTPAHQGEASFAAHPVAYTTGRPVLTHAQPQQPIRLSEKRKSDIAPPPGSSIAAYSSMLTPFIYKLYCLVSDDSTTELCHWSPNGESFVVPDPTAFAASVLPRFFKHNQFASFVRQLNKYRFHKLTPGTCIFGHAKFVRDRPDLLPEIVRQRSPDRPVGSVGNTQPSAVHSPTAASPATPGAPVAISGPLAVSPPQSVKRQAEGSPGGRTVSEFAAARAEERAASGGEMATEGELPVSAAVGAPELESLKCRIDSLAVEMGRDRAVVESRLDSVEKAITGMARTLEEIERRLR